MKRFEFLDFGVSAARRSAERSAERLSRTIDLALHSGTRLEPNYHVVNGDAILRRRRSHFDQKQKLDDAGKINYVRLLVAIKLFRSNSFGHGFPCSTS